MARVSIAKPESVDDPEVEGIFAWVTEMEGSVPNHFYVELNFPEFFKAKLGATKVLWEEGELTMEEIQHVGILVSKDNGCEYCTAAFCTILSHGLGTSDDYIASLLSDGVPAVESDRLGVLLDYALQVNSNAGNIEDVHFERLRAVGLSDKGIVQVTHLVSDFGSYNRLNMALQTDYDYRDFWRELAFKKSD